MYIIFGENMDVDLDNYTLLELDSFYDIKTKKRATAWCVIEKISLEDFPLLDRCKKAHQSLIQCYKNQEWKLCKEWIKFLKGQWNGEMDSYYDILEKRIQDLESASPIPDWSATIIEDC